MDPTGTYHGDSDLQLERINVYFNEATGGKPGHTYELFAIADATFRVFQGAAATAARTRNLNGWRVGLAAAQFPLPDQQRVVSLHHIQCSYGCSWLLGCVQVVALRSSVALLTTLAG